ncbi:MAG: hypothetical protein DRI84_08100 [Bacteroidetes bacterium]|nr:MAG: hypothetical protein DRI84_08100 [Bacteroidota bacterium]
MVILLTISFDRLSYRFSTSSATIDKLSYHRQAKKLVPEPVEGQLPTFDRLSYHRQDLKLVPELPALSLSKGSLFILWFPQIAQIDADYVSAKISGKSI